MTTRQRAWTIFGGIAAVAVAGLALLTGGEHGRIDDASAQQQQRRLPSSRNEVQLSFAPIVKKTAPAVVNVYVRSRVQTFNSPFANDPFFERFFGRGFGNRQGGRSNERVLSSLGSGVIIDPTGIIVTNTHVVRGRGDTEIRVALADNREFDAKVIAQDDKTDIAVLKIDSRTDDFPFLEFEDSDSLEVGDLVLAIGNPFGVGQTVTSGIVSAQTRSSLGQNDMQVFIQTDAAINPGNSGGALVDMSGRLVGINTMIYSRSGGSVGIGFAIPSNLVRVYADSAARGRKVQRPWLGARLDKVSRDVAEGLGLDRISGALVTRVYDKGPAADGGLEAGDVIVSVDGVTVADPRAVFYRMTTKGVGNNVALTVLRKGRRQTVTIALKAAPQAGKDDVRILSGQHPLDGASVSNIFPALADELDLESTDGVVIITVTPGSTAQALGFKEGDLIVEAQGRPVRAVASLEEQLSRRQRIWQIGVRRGGRLLTLQVPG